MGGTSEVKQEKARLSDALKNLIELYNINHKPWLLEVALEYGILQVGSNNMNEFIAALKNCICPCL